MLRLLDSGDLEARVSHQGAPFRGTGLKDSLSRVFLMEPATLYSALQLDQTATAHQIKKQYRKLAILNHPDKNPNDKAAEERFKTLAHAYHTLSDPEKRRQYDQQLIDDRRNKHTSHQSPSHYNQQTHNTHQYRQAPFHTPPYGHHPFRTPLHRDPFNMSLHRDPFSVPDSGHRFGMAQAEAIFRAFFSEDCASSLMRSQDNGSVRVFESIIRPDGTRIERSLFKPAHTEHVEHFERAMGSMQEDRVRGWTHRGAMTDDDAALEEALRRSRLEDISRVDSNLAAIEEDAALQEAMRLSRTDAQVWNDNLEAEEQAALQLALQRSALEH